MKSEGATHIALGSEDGKVIMRFPKSVSWMAVEPDQAALIGEKFIMCAAELGLKIEIPQEKRELTAMQRAAIDARVALVLRNLIERKSKPEYIAKQIIDVVLREYDA